MRILDVHQCFNLVMILLMFPDVGSDFARKSHELCNEMMKGRSKQWREAGLQGVARIFFSRELAKQIIWPAVDRIASYSPVTEYTSATPSISRRLCAVSFTCPRCTLIRTRADIIKQLLVVAVFRLPEQIHEIQIIQLPQTRLVTTCQPG